MGTRNTSCRTMDVTMEYIDFPSAWNELPSAMHIPAMQKLRAMMRRAGTPAASITSLASKSRSSVSGHISFMLGQSEFAPT